MTDRLREIEGRLEAARELCWRVDIDAPNAVAPEDNPCLLLADIPYLLERLREAERELQDLRNRMLTF